MKKDYLWDKTGNDAEIERLENALQEFRSKNTTPPEIPSKTFAFDRTALPNPNPRRFFKLAWTGFAAAAGLLIFSIGIFQVLNFEKQETAKTQPEQTSNEKSTENLPIAVEEKPSDEKSSEAIDETKPKVVKAKSYPQRNRAKRFVKNKKRVSVEPSANKTIAGTVKPVKKDLPDDETLILTKEEKQAYDQLMKALAITSSSLKTVKDKAQGIEE